MQIVSNRVNPEDGVTEWSTSVIIIEAKRISPERVSVNVCFVLISLKHLAGV